MTGVNRGFWRGKEIFVTGHTGFKGGWLVTWLEDMGARVTGYSLAPETERSFYDSCGIGRRVRSLIGDIRDPERLQSAIKTARPEIVFHLAAQALVRRSYQEPTATFATNVMGTANVLDAVRHSPSVRTVLVVTSDKCYENREWMWSYRENEPLGGKDPYSSSKACAELVTTAFRHSFFENGDRPIGAATARAGNVFGGGDWAEDRLVPDAIRALSNHDTLFVRNAGAIRPWQHVLEPLGGYLQLAEKLNADGRRWAGAWNFGPAESDVDVGSLATSIVEYWGSGRWEAASTVNQPHEANCLKLDSSKAGKVLGWRPRLTLDEAMELTVAWYRKALEGKPEDEMYRLTRDQIASYEAKFKRNNHADTTEMPRLQRAAT